MGSWGAESDRDRQLKHPWSRQAHHDNRQKHVYPVVFYKGQKYATQNGYAYRKVYFAFDHFWWRNHHGHRFMMPIRRFNGHPVIFSNRHYWGTQNGREYFPVENRNGHYHPIQHLHLHMHVHLGHVRTHYFRHHRLSHPYHRQWVLRRHRLHHGIQHLHLRMPHHRWGHHYHHQWDHINWRRLELHLKHEESSLSPWMGPYSLAES